MDQLGRRLCQGTLPLPAEKAVPSLEHIIEIVGIEPLLVKRVSHVRRTIGILERNEANLVSDIKLKDMTAVVECFVAIRCPCI